MTYYDIDSILTEEELIPCTTLFTFSHLAYLDPNFISITRKGALNQETATLPEGSRINIPIWWVEKWATLGFVKLSLPRHFRKRTRERVEADPASADLSRIERFFSSGIALINLIRRCLNAITAEVARSGQRRRSQIQTYFEQVAQEGEALRNFLVDTYAGRRLRRTFDWSYTSINDDVSTYTRRLTDIENRLFRRGAEAAMAYNHWKTNVSRLIPVSRAFLATKAVQPVRVVSPENQQQKYNWFSSKRLRVN